MLKKCVECGDEFYSESSNSRFCSRDCRSVYKKRAYQKDKSKVNARSIQKRYGITVEQRDALVLNQGGCAICHVPTPTGKNWHVDHDHSCCPGSYTCGDCVRGILCDRCNIGLGGFGDDPEKLLAAAVYIKSYQRDNNR